MVSLVGMGGIYYGDCKCLLGLKPSYGGSCMVVLLHLASITILTVALPCFAPFVI